MWQLKLYFKEKNISLNKMIWTYKKGYNFAKILIWDAKHPKIYILLPLKYHFEKKNYKKIQSNDWIMLLTTKNFIFLFNLPFFGSCNEKFLNSDWKFEILYQKFTNIYKFWRSNLFCLLWK